MDHTFDFDSVDWVKNCRLYIPEEKFTTILAWSREEYVRDEIKVLNQLTEEGLDFIHNEALPGTRLRPDFLFVRDFFLVVLEVDEYEHHEYDKITESTRELLIKCSLEKPVQFIRYNPSGSKADN